MNDKIKNPYARAFEFEGEKVTKCVLYTSYGAVP